ncbi:MAG: TonB family protein [Sphingobium sp.]|nr:TonB family protein [Sphingobium sp.]
MTQLALPASAHEPSFGTGYAAGRRRSPSALVAALAINGGAFAIILLMPATQYIIDQVGVIHTTNIPIERDPDEVKPVKAQEHSKTQIDRPIPQHDDTMFVLPPITPLGNTGPTIGDVIPDLGTLGRVGPVDPPIAPHTPVFVKASQDPRYAKAFHPDYPPSLVREGLEGSVTVRVSIDATGRVSAIELIKATNPAFFEETRDQALRYWRFKPATSDGTPVASQQVLTVQFNLEDQ